MSSLETLRNLVISGSIQHYVYRQCSGPVDIAESAKHSERRRKLVVDKKDGNAEDCRVFIAKRSCLSKDRSRSRKSSKPRRRDEKTNISFQPPASLKSTALLPRHKAIGRSVATTPRPRRRRPSSSHGARATATLLQQDNPSASLNPELQEPPTWAVDRIVSSARTRGRLFYRVRWEDTWEPADTLEDCAAAAIADYHTLRRARR